MKEFVIEKKDSSQRIDKYVKKYLKNAPVSFIYKTFRKKDIKVNGKWVKENYILNENDVVSIFVTDEKIEEFIETDEFKPIKYNLDIIYEDENILIVNKDRGILIHGDKNEKKYTLSNEVLSYLIEKGEYHPKTDNFIPSPVHRLDRNTSGLVVFAKNLISSKEAMELFKEKNNIEKHYIALVFGSINGSGIIKAPLLKNSNTNTVTVNFSEGKDAITEYKKIDGNDEYSLINVNLITGRTHQIRVHMSYIKYPIVGDEKYGNFNLNKIFEKKYGYSKQFLHSYSLEFKNICGHLSYLSNKKIIANLKEGEQKILDLLSLKYYL